MTDDPIDYEQLERELQELERTDPAVRAARDQYDATVRDIVGRTVTHIFKGEGMFCGECGYARIFHAWEVDAAK